MHIMRFLYFVNDAVVDLQYLMLFTAVGIFIVRPTIITGCWLGPKNVYHLYRPANVVPQICLCGAT